MGPKNFQELSGEVSAFMHSVQFISDASELASLRSFAGLRVDSSWRLAEAFILLRQNLFSELVAFLESLPLEFHSYSQYWLLLGLGLRRLPNSNLLAINAYSKGLDIDPSRSDLHYNIANCFLDTDIASAFSHFSTSLCLDPFQSNAWHNFGVLLRDKKLYRQARSAFLVSLLLDPFDINAYINLGLVYISLGSLEPAELSFIHAISLNPAHPPSLINLGSLLVSLRRVDEASSCLQNVAHISSGSNYSTALFNLGLCHLLLSRFSTGWIYYEERLRTDQVPISCHPSQGPIVTDLFDFTSPSESPLLVWAEQGVGDAIQFSRYLLLLDNLDIHYEFHCPVELISLIRDWMSPKCRIVELNSTLRDTEFRTHCPLMSLPRLFSTDIDTVPSALPYFSSPTDIPDKFIVKSPPGGLSFGIVWASNSINKRMYVNKSIPLSLLLDPLLAVLDLDLISLHSLQVGSDSSQLNSLISHPRIFDWSNSFQDFQDTAYVCSQLDLIITVDTAVAHLAASLSRPTWLLLPYDSDFRWLCDRLDSPWYPGVMRLFRQSVSGDWSNVIHELQLALDDLFKLDIASLSSYKSKL